MNKKINILYADSKGGIKTVSNILDNTFKDNSINSELFNMNDFGNTLFKKLFNSYKEIKKYNKSDIFILQHFDPIFIGIFLNLIGYKNIINVIHTDVVDYYNSVGKLKKIIIRFMMFMIRKKPCIFVSKEAEIKAKNRFSLINTKVIYNIYNFHKDIKISNKSNKIVLGTVSRMHKIKNIDLAICIIYNLKKQGKNIELLIYGDGDKNEIIDLENLVNSLDASSYIKFMGAEANKEKIYSSIDALISFSTVEGLPTVILESINYKKPIFYTDCSSGPREIMSSNSNPLEKTKYFEKTNVGYLVKPLKQNRNYELNLDKYEMEYIEILNKFIDDVSNNSFSMEFDNTQFSSNKIINEWKNTFSIFESN